MTPLVTGAAEPQPQRPATQAGWAGATSPVPALPAVAARHAAQLAAWPVAPWIRRKVASLAPWRAPRWRRWPLQLLPMPAGRGYTWSTAHRSWGSCSVGGRHKGQLYYDRSQKLARAAICPEGDTGPDGRCTCRLSECSFELFRCKTRHSVRDLSATQARAAANRLVSSDAIQRVECCSLEHNLGL